MTSSSPKVLMVGLSPDGPNVPEAVRAEIKGKLEAAKKPLTEAFGEQGKGWEYGMVSPPTVQSDLQKYLTLQKWDVIIIGNGVRGNPSLTVVFEKLVNEIHKHSPHALFGFNNEPSENIHVANRVWSNYAS